MCTVVVVVMVVVVMLLPHHGELPPQKQKHRASGAGHACKYPRTFVPCRLELDRTAVLRLVDLGQIVLEKRPGGLPLT